MHITRKRPETRQGPAENFTGTVWLDEVAAPEPPSRLRMFNVHFAPGAHTAWHRHPHGQVLHVLEGEGLVQREGGEVEPIRAGVGAAVGGAGLRGGWRRRFAGAARRTATATGAGRSGVGGGHGGRGA
ncbi:cupin domain-containing protein [Streptomyces sp. WM6386]|uniref:cupin domain-containing protein n=1 Tax=Streptomyces sp. WM6386 TaxID=1415558 RepID=UPI000B263AD5|nr:cupin domain-containing protein [Streptomyces sp. WM6386]